MRRRRRRRPSGPQLLLALIWRALEKKDGENCEKDDAGSHTVRLCDRYATDAKRDETEDDGRGVQDENGAPLPETKRNQPVSGMVLPRRCEWQKAAEQAGDRH